MPDDTMLKVTLSAAVPLWILKIQNECWTPEYRHERIAICGETVAFKGDIILFRGRKPGETAEAFNRLAEGIALLSFAPGGVTTFGMHFESKE